MIHGMRKQRTSSAGTTKCPSSGVIRGGGVFEVLDGFGYHEFESPALEMRAKKNILSVKEDSKTFHINQEYDQLVAKNNKKKSAETLACQIKMKHVNKGVVDQYQLVLTVISIVKEMK